MLIRFRLTLSPNFKYDFTQLKYSDLTYHGKNIIDVVYCLGEMVDRELGVLLAYDNKDSYKISFRENGIPYTGSAFNAPCELTKMVENIKVDYL